MRVYYVLWVLIAVIVAGCQQIPHSEIDPPILPTPTEDFPATSPPVTMLPATPQATATFSAAYLPRILGDADVIEATPLPNTPSPAPTPSYPLYNGAPINRQDLGVQIHLHREDLEQIMRHLQALDVGWVKVQVSWKLYEPQPGRFDEARFRELDQLVSRATANNIQVLLSVAKAPEWSRPVTEMDGPPADYAHFETFMRTLATRYQGNLAAYELWNEPNLQREWHGFPLNPADFVELLGYGAAGVRAVDTGAILISGAPATTGINDGVTAIDDREFLQGMIYAGVGEVVDGIGVHPYGWANPPQSSVMLPDRSVPTHNNHRSFFFQDTMNDYRAILDAAGYIERELWITEFGWGSFDTFDASPPAGAEFMNQVTAWQQAQYTLEAVEMATNRPGIGPLILWNLNFAPLLGPDFSEAGYSILDLEGAPRPVYHAVQSIPRE